MDLYYKNLYYFYYNNLIMYHHLTQCLKYYNDFLEVNDGAKPFGDNIIENWIETSLSGVSRKQFTI